MQNKMLNIFERIIIGALMVLMCFTIAFSIIDITANLIRQFFHPPFLLLDINRLLDTFGMFLLLLIGLELLETVKTYFLERTVHVQYILLVAMIAVARKLTILDVKEVGPLPLAAMGGAILALSASYYLFQKTHAAKPRQ